MEERNEWATPALKEVPFWREGMTAEEYDIEREYYAKHFDMVKSQQYVPLWKQALQKVNIAS